MHALLFIKVLAILDSTQNMLIVSYWCSTPLRNHCPHSFLNFHKLKSRRTGLQTHNWINSVENPWWFWYNLPLHIFQSYQRSLILQKTSWKLTDLGTQILTTFLIVETCLKVLAAIQYFSFHFFPHLLIFLQFRDLSYELNLSTKAVLQKWHN